MLTFELCNKLGARKKEEKGWLEKRKGSKGESEKGNMNKGKWGEGEKGRLEGVSVWVAEHTHTLSIKLVDGSKEVEVISALLSLNYISIK